MKRPGEISAGFLSAESLVYFVFGLIAVVCYGVGYLLWLRSGLNSVWLLGLLFVVLYPSFYAAVSMALFVAVCRLPALRKSRRSGSSAGAQSLVDYMRSLLCEQLLS